MGLNAPFERDASRGTVEETHDVHRVPVSAAVHRAAVEQWDGEATAARSGRRVDVQAHVVDRHRRAAEALDDRVDEARTEVLG